jgi:hypothetical protein
MATVKAKKAAKNERAVSGNNTEVIPPTIEIATQLQEAYTHFNRELFDGKLPDCVLGFARLKKAHGYFWAKQWVRRGKKVGNTHEIALDPIRCAAEKDKDVLGTLVHEMIHCEDEEEGTAPKKPYHTKQWAERMKRVGLHPSTTGQPGGKETGRNCSHYIVAGGRFDVAAKALLDSGFKFNWHAVPVIEVEKKKKKRAGGKFKYEAECGNAFWAKPGLEATCQCGCDSKFVQLEKPDEEQDTDGDEG